MTSMNEACNTEVCKTDQKACSHSLLARYSIARGDSSLAWRCYCTQALTADLAMYDQANGSDCVFPFASGLETILKQCKSWTKLCSYLGFTVISRKIMYATEVFYDDDDNDNYDDGDYGGDVNYDYDDDFNDDDECDDNDVDHNYEDDGCMSLRWRSWYGLNRI